MFELQQHLALVCYSFRYFSLFAIKLISHLICIFVQTEQEEEMGETKGGFSFEENKSYKKIVEIDRSKTDYLQLFIISSENQHQK